MVSLNIARKTQTERILNDVRKSKQLEQADVWLLQEVAQPTNSRYGTVHELARELDLNYVFAPADILDNGKLISGLAILSRYPIQDARVIRLLRHNVKVRTRCRIALEAKVNAPFDSIKVYNVHLDTRITWQQRLDQINPVLEAANSSPGPAIVGGDFNTANIRWFGNMIPVPFAQKHSDRLRRLLQEKGFESPHDTLRGTVHFLWLSLRLDWIFPKGMKRTAAGVEDIDFSDHRAVWMELSRP